MLRLSSLWKVLTFNFRINKLLNKLLRNISQFILLMVRNCNVLFIIHQTQVLYNILSFMLIKLVNILCMLNFV